MSVTNERLAEIERDVGPAVGNSEVIYMARELQQRREAEQWRSIETAPKDGTEFLGFYGHGSAYMMSIVHLGWTEYDGTPCWSNGDVASRLYTHWRPLPAPPEVA